MSNTFNHAYGMYDDNEAIRLYNLELENNPTNFAALNNRGVRKVHKAIETKDKHLLEDALQDFEKAIFLANENDKKGYPIAEENVKWAKQQNL